MRKIILTAITIVLSLQISEAQNVGINGNGVAPNSSAMLDVDVSTLGASSKKGMLMPRVALTSMTDASTIPSPATSLYVYNTATAGVAPSQVYPGYYYWDGAKWVRMVDFVVERFYYPPTTINNNTAYNLLATVPGCTTMSSAFVNIIGDWPTPPGLSISYVESKTGQVRFRVVNTSGVNYNSMDFIITVIR